MRFTHYTEVHENLSSKMTLSHELGILRKQRPERSAANLKNEFIALVASNLLLDLYYDEEMPVNLKSPFPHSYDVETKTIDMEFVLGGTVGSVVAGAIPPGIPIDKDKTWKNIAFGLGRYSGIKHHEGFVHGDYKQRHVLYNPTRPRHAGSRMSIIDLESMRPTEEVEEVTVENRSMYEWLLSTRRDSPRHSRTAIEMYTEGFHSVSVREEPMMRDIITSLQI